ncbi:MAG: TRAP transporter large permease subunit [Betaproteobacteria bacterium]|nr:TRAP transporter large permease subunit [Betaproteobacteria bacterium]
MEGLIGFPVFILALLVFLATGTPVAVATGLLGVIGVYLFLPHAAITQLGNIAFSQPANFVLVVVPLFVMMGEALAATTVGRDLFTAAQIWLRRLPGALAVGTIIACAGFGAVCGSSPVTAATIGGWAVPEMMRKGYSPRLALGAAAAGGTLGILIPPSIPMILYGVITETSIGALFIAGIVPGLLLTLLLSATVFIQVMRNPALAPRATEGLATRERWTSLRAVIPVAILALLVLSSIYAGVATPSEAGAVGALGALIVAAALGALTRAVTRRILHNTVRTTAMFILLIIGGLFSSFVLTRLGIPQATAKMIIEASVAPWIILVLINLLLIVLGMFMDPMSILVIVVPVFFPTVVALGYDPVGFGIVITINLEIAAISPPVGFNLFVLKTVIPGVDMRDIIAGSLIFMVPLALGIGLLIAWPEIALFLPRLMRN